VISSSSRFWRNPDGFSRIPSTTDSRWPTRNCNATCFDRDAGVFGQRAASMARLGAASGRPSGLNQPVSFRDGINSAGEIMPALGMRPAHKSASKPVIARRKKIDHG